MANRTWNIDGKEVVGNEDSIIHWEDDTFFSISYNGNTFSGEILEENTEGNFLKLKINHRVFTVQKRVS